MDSRSPVVSRRCTVQQLSLFRGRPGHRLQLRSGRRPSDRSMWPHKAWWAGMSSGSLVTCPNSELRRPTDDWIHHRTKTCQRGNVRVPHKLLPTDLGYNGIGTSCGRLPAFLCRRRVESRSHRRMSKLVGQEFGKPGLW